MKANNNQHKMNQFRFLWKVLLLSTYLLGQRTKHFIFASHLIFHPPREVVLLSFLVHG